MKNYKYISSWNRDEKKYKEDSENLPELKEQYQRIEDSQFVEFITRTKIARMGYDFSSTPGKEFQFDFKGDGEFQRSDTGFKVIGKRGSVAIEYNQIHDVLYVEEKGKKIFDLKDIKGNNLLIWVVE